MKNIKLKGGCIYRYKSKPVRLVRTCGVMAVLKLKNGKNSVGRADLLTKASGEEVRAFCD